MKIFLKKIKGKIANIKLFFMKYIPIPLVVKISQCNSGWPKTPNVEQVSPEITYIHQLVSPEFCL